MIKIKKNHLYKIKHKNIIVGETYNTSSVHDSFTPITNSIIFMPKNDMFLYPKKYNNIPTDFLITFTNDIRINGNTSFSDEDCIFEPLTYKEILMVGAQLKSASHDFRINFF